MRGLFKATILSLALAFGSPAFGQEPEPPTVDPLVVTPKAEDPADAFVDGLTVKRRKGTPKGQIARWRAPVCVLVLGGTPGGNARIAARLAAVIRAEKLEAKAGNCRPNAVVVLTDQPDLFAERFARSRRIGFFKNSASDLAAFKAAPGPVRWAHAFFTGSPEGPKMLAQPLAGFDGPAGALPDSKLELSTPEVIELGIVVVDVRQMADVPPDALIHYIAFILLADLPPGASSGGQPSILNLFEPTDGPPPRTFSTWDRGFLKGLYTSMSLDQPFGVQREQIERTVREALAGEP